MLWLPFSGIFHSFNPRNGMIIAIDYIFLSIGWNRLRNVLDQIFFAECNLRLSLQSKTQQKFVGLVGSCRFWGANDRISETEESLKFFDKSLQSIGSRIVYRKGNLVEQAVHRSGVNRCEEWVASEMKQLGFTGGRSPCHILSYGIGAVQDLAFCWECDLA